MQLYDYLLLAFEKQGYRVPSNSKGITKQSLLEFLSNYTSVGRGALGYTSAGGINSFLKKVFPDKKDNRRYDHFLLAKLDKKLCSKCSNIYNISDFHINKSKVDGLSQYCKDCDRDAQRIIAPAREAKRRASKLNATPAWANMAIIRDFYKNCPTGYHVDHIVPIQNDKVYGLHVIENLQYLTAEDNLAKGNKFIIE